MDECEQKIDGNLLREMGYRPGPAFKDILLWSAKLELRSPELSLDERVKLLKEQFPPEEVEERNRLKSLRPEREPSSRDKLVFQPLEDLLLSIRDATLREKALEIFKATREASQYLPASIRFHHTERGGYLRHLTEVVNLAARLFEMLQPPGISRDEVVLLSFIHDLSKLESYEMDPEATQKEQREYLATLNKGGKNGEAAGEARRTPAEEEKGRLNDIVVFRRRERVPTSHFGKTLIMAQSFGLPLTDRWIHAIEQHHGPYSDFKTPQVHNLALIIYTADYLSSKMYSHRNDVNYTIE